MPLHSGGTRHHAVSARALSTMFPEKRPRSESDVPAVSAAHLDVGAKGGQEPTTCEPGKMGTDPERLPREGRQPTGGTRGRRRLRRR